MPARLILNADDFGLTRGINRAVSELHRVGVLTSATLMADGPAFDDAVAIARNMPTLGVGCHVVLVDGTPVSPLHEIPTLLGPNGRTFRASLLDFVRDLYLGHIDEAEIAHEAQAQLQKLQRAGIDVTHLDTHKHTHVFPPVARALVDLVNKSSVGSMRLPFEPAFSRKISHSTTTRRLQMALLERLRPEFQLLAANTLTTDGTLGIAATGTLDSDTLHRLLNALPDGRLFELVCHPGYYDADLDRLPTRLRASREIERKALLATIPEILARPHPLELIHYGMLGRFGAMREIGLFYPGTGYEKY